MPFIFVVCTVVFVYAEQVCVYIFGSEYANAAAILRIMLPIVVFTLPTYLLGFPTLGAMGLSKHANNSIIIAAIIQIFTVIYLIATSSISVISIAISTTVCESIVLIYRLIAVYNNRYKMDASL